jgi:uncharacterized protein involved in exopolysaccharide biosynthesis
LLQLVVQRWRLSVTLLVVGGIAGGLTGLLLPSYYRSSAAFQAEASTAPAISGALAGLASQIGSLNLASQNNAQLFADLLSTDAVLRRVAASKYSLKGIAADLAAIYGYQRKAPGWREYYTLRKLRKALEVDVNIRTGVVRFSIEGRTPELAKALTDTTLVALNDANIALRRTRAAAERDFTAQQAADAQGELSAAEGDLRKFYERNRMIANSPSLQLEEARLRRSVDMAQQLYVQLRIQEEQAALQEVRNTPAISVIDPPMVPVKRSWPKRRLAIALGAFTGLGMALVVLSFGLVQRNAPA